LENRLNSLVCSGQLLLADAQQAIASNWVAAYAKYMGVQPPSSAQSATTTTSAPASTPTPAQPPTPAPPPPPSSSCTASMSNPTPGDGGSVTANVSSNVPNTAGTVTAYYKTTTHPFPFQTDSSGAAAITFDIGHPTVGFRVAVNVSLGTATCSTSFTPQ